MSFKFAIGGTTRLSYANGAEFDDLTAITVCGWVRIPAGHDSQTHDIISLWDYPSDKSWILARSNSTNKWFFEVAYNDTNNTDFLSPSSATVSTGQWYHVCGTWTTTYRALYVDGVELANDSNSRTTISDSNASLTVGGQNGGTANTFEGDLYQACIWLNQALSATEVAALADGVSPLQFGDSGPDFLAQLEAHDDVYEEDWGPYRLQGAVSSLGSSGTEDQNPPVTPLIQVPRTRFLEEAAATDPGNNWVAAHVRRAVERDRTPIPSTRGFRPTHQIGHITVPLDEVAPDYLAQHVRRMVSRDRTQPASIRGFRPPALIQGVAVPDVGVDFLAAHVRRMALRDRSPLPSVRGFRPAPRITPQAVPSAAPSIVPDHVRRISQRQRALPSSLRGFRPPFRPAVQTPSIGGVPYLAEHVRRMALRKRELDLGLRGYRPPFRPLPLPAAGGVAPSDYLAEHVRRQVYRDRTPIPSVRGLRPIFTPGAPAAVQTPSDYLSDHVLRMVNLPRRSPIGKRGFRPPQYTPLGVVATTPGATFLPAHVVRACPRNRLLRM